MGVGKYVLITGLGSLNLACSGMVASPCEEAAADQPCWPDERTCYVGGQSKESMNCGLNGHTCQDGKWKKMFTYCNPPRQPVLESACADAVVGEACSPDEKQCYLEGQSSKGHNCGLNGHECEDGKWKKMFTYCNPPPMRKIPKK